MKNVKNYFSLIIILIVIITGCGKKSENTTSNIKDNNEISNTLSNSNNTSNENSNNKSSEIINCTKKISNSYGTSSEVNSILYYENDKLVNFNMTFLANFPSTYANNMKNAYQTTLNSWKKSYESTHSSVTGKLSKDNYYVRADMNMGEFTSEEIDKNNLAIYMKISPENAKLALLKAGYDCDSSKK